MIGEDIRSLHHLYRKCEPYILRKMFMLTYDRGVIAGYALRIKGAICFFNDHIKQDQTTFLAYVNADDKLKKIIDDNRLGGYRCHFTLYNDLRRGFDMFARGVILLPETFEDDLNKFVMENGKFMEKIGNKYGSYKSDNNFQLIYIMANGSKNFMEWAISAVYDHGIRLSTISSIMQWYDLYPNLSKALKRGTITAYNGFGRIMDLMQELIAFRKEKRVGESISQFNTAQKKMLRDAELSERNKNALAKFSKLSDKKRMNFIKKMSSVSDLGELLKHLSHITSAHFSWSKEDFIDHIKNIEGMNVRIVYEKDGIVLLQVNDYDAIKYVAKTTNWCISKNKTYWNQYINNGKKSSQYVILDFSKKEDDNLSIIGFTITQNIGITSAHDFVNNNLMPNGDRHIEDYQIVSFLKGYINKHDIYSILSMDGIDVEMVMSFEKPRFEWSKEGVFDFLSKHVDMDNLEVYKDEENKLVIGVQDSGIRAMFCDQYDNVIDVMYYDNLHVIFFDFNKKNTNPDAMLLGVIGVNDKGNEECILFTNQFMNRRGNSFNQTLTEYGLPYDIIKRPLNIETSFKDAFTSYAINEKVMNSISKERIRDIIRNKIGLDTSTNMFIQTILSVGSLDYINLFASKDVPLSYFLDKDHVGYMLQDLYRVLFTKCTIVFPYEYDNRLYSLQIPSEEMIAQLVDMTLPSKEHAIYVCTYLALTRIIEMECRAVEKNPTFCPNKSFKRLISSIRHSDCINAPLNKHLIELCLPAIERRNDEAKQDLLAIALALDNGCPLKKQIVKKMSETPVEVADFATVTSSNIDLTSAF